MYTYSMREKTHAHRQFVDDVPEEVKHRRLREVS
jgi:tRNA A37 methylthiotransferase MiaB